MNLIDLTQAIRSNTPVFPGDKTTQLDQVRSIEEDGFTNFRLISEMHVGTHLDGPLHKISESPFIADLPLNHFTGKGVLIDVRGENQVVFRESYRTLIPQKNIVLFFSGLSDHFSEKDYFISYPDLTDELARFLVEQRVKMVGLDWCSPDHHPYPIHEILLGNNILILENLTNLDQLLDKPNFEVFAFPLKIEADSSPVRVVAKVNNK